MSSNPDKPRRLGRGLEALLGPSASTPAPSSDMRRLSISQIRPNPFQPRRTFAPEELAELQASLRANGLLQPITVRTAPAGAGFELVAGERRLRAATAIGWTEIPALIKEFDDRAMLTLALVENLQRANLNPVEEAEGYLKLQEAFELTQQQIAEAVGRDRVTVANALRLLGLPAAVRRMLVEGQLSAGHGRALLAVKDPTRLMALAREAATGGLSVREVERRVRESGSRGSKPDSTSKAQPAAKRELRNLEDQLRKHFQTDVTVATEGSDRGEIRLRFYSSEDLERLFELLLRPGSGFGD